MAGEYLMPDPRHRTLIYPQGRHWILGQTERLEHREG